LAGLIRKSAVFLGLLGLLIAPAAKAGPSVLFDAATGEVISHERAGEPWYPASLTKLMTAYIVFKKLKAGSLRLDQKILVSSLAASQEPSKIGLRPGSSISVDLALQTLLVYSANDMAVLAEAQMARFQFCPGNECHRREAGVERHALRESQWLV
jgi:D-alanyl-D-alanine carboxypeptidase